MVLRSDETWQRLRLWTYGQTPSERLAAQVLIDAGYTDVDPIHPLGGPDGGKDAIGARDGLTWIMAVYFPHDAQTYATIKAKAVSDATGVAKNSAHGMAFVTNQKLTSGERADLKAAVDVPLDLFHLERLVTTLDKPAMHGVRRQYLNIDYGSIGPERVGPTEAQLLDSALGAANVRRMQRLRAAGVAAERRAHVEAWMRTHQQRSLVLPSGRSLTLLSAPMGYGKTELAHDWLEARIRDAISSSDAPFPLWVHARDVSGPVEAHVIGQLSRAIVHEIGCAVVLDGLDQLPPAAAVALLESAEEFCGAWPKATVVATAKPEPLLDSFPIQTVDPWTIEDGRRLAEAVAGADLPYAWWTDEVAQALRTPLLAVTIGARAASGASSPPSRSTLIAEIAAQSLHAARIRPSTAVTNALITIAAKTLATGKPFRANQLDPDTLAQITATPLVIERSGELSFALPVIELIYAARAITTGQVSLAHAATSEQFPRWRHALALAVDSDDAAESDDRFAAIVAANPVAASWVLTEVVAESSSQTGRSTTPLSLTLRHEVTVYDPDSQLTDETLVLLRQLRDAHLTWVDALGRQLVGAGTQSPPPGWSVNADERHMLIGRRTVSDEVDIRGMPMPPHLFQMPNELITNHTSIRLTMRPVGKLSRWRWSRDDLREELKIHLERYTLDSDPAGTLAAERAWHLAQMVIHGGVRLDHTPIPVAELQQEIDDKLVQTVSAASARFETGSGYYTREDLVWLQQWLGDQMPAGNPTLCRPGPTPDRTPTGGPAWSWSLYSAQQMYALTLTALRGAAEGYVDLVARNFPNAGNALSHIDISPLRIVGEVITARDDLEYGGIETSPMLRYTITKAPVGATEPVIDVTHAFHGDPPRHIDIAQYKWLSQTALSVEGARPATQWAYQWLIDDLAAVGWVERSWNPTI